MLNIPVRFEDMLKMLLDLPPEQKRIIRERLDEDWAARFGNALDRIHDDIPSGLSDEETQADVEAAIEESRRNA